MFSLIAVVSLLYVSFAQAVQYRFPQFTRDGMQEEDRFDMARLEAINGFVEEFRGWQDDQPNTPPEIKVINVTTEIYKREILGSNQPWILAFVKKFKSMDHLVHSEELYQNLQILADEF